MNRPALFLACALALPPALLLSSRSPLEGPSSAEASVAVRISLEDLVATSTYVLIGTAGDHHSVWEDLPSGRRIVTYTRIAVERAVVGAPGTEIWVRSLGGAVGKLGQSVPGEAQLTAGSRALVFVTQTNGVAVVTARAQGHYPIVSDDKGTPRLASSPDPSMLVPRRGPTISAQERLLGATVDEALAAVKQATRGAR
jgi:hypothetical protein